MKVLREERHLLTSFEKTSLTRLLKPRENVGGAEESCTSRPKFEYGRESTM